MSDEISDQLSPAPLVNVHVLLEQDFTGSDAQQLMMIFAQAMNKVVGVALASGKFTAANPVIQHAMQASASLEAASANLHQQLQQASNIVNPFDPRAMAGVKPGPRGMN